MSFDSTILKLLEDYPIASTLFLPSGVPHPLPSSYASMLPAHVDTVQDPKYHVKLSNILSHKYIGGSRAPLSKDTLESYNPWTREEEAEANNREKTRRDSPENIENMFSEQDISTALKYEQTVFNTISEVNVQFYTRAFAFASEVFATKIAPILVKHLRALSWPEWTHSNGNPFVVRITKNNAAKLLVPDYFKFIKNPMDLTRMSEKVAQKRYDTPASFFEDVFLICYNAKVYNGPRTSKQKDFVFPPASEVGGVYAMACELEEKAKNMQSKVQEAFNYLINQGKRTHVMEYYKNYTHYLDRVMQTKILIGWKKCAESKGFLNLLNEAEIPIVISNPYSPQ